MASSSSSASVTSSTAFASSCACDVQVSVKCTLALSSRLVVRFDGATIATASATRAFTVLPSLRGWEGSSTARASVVTYASWAHCDTTHFRALPAAAFAELTHKSEGIPKGTTECAVVHPIA